MSVRLPYLLAVVLVAACASVVMPAAALAGDGGQPKHHKHSSSCVSAVCVYHEQNQTAGGQVSAGQAPPGKPAQLSTKAGHALDAHAGKDANALDALVTNPALGFSRMPLVSSSDARTPPGAFGAAFDIGPGPIALFAALLAAGLLVVGGAALGRRARP